MTYGAWGQQEAVTSISKPTSTSQSDPSLRQSHTQSHGGGHGPGHSQRVSSTGGTGNWGENMNTNTWGELSLQPGGIHSSQNQGENAAGGNLNGTTDYRLSQVNQNHHGAGGWNQNSEHYYQGTSYDTQTAQAGQGKSNHQNLNQTGTNTQSHYNSNSGHNYETHGTKGHAKNYESQHHKGTTTGPFHHGNDVHSTSQAWTGTTS